MVKKINESKEVIKESLVNFTIVSDLDEEGTDIVAETAVEAIQEFKETYGDQWIISEVYDEADTYYDAESGEEIVEESLTEDVVKDWEVKQISMDVAVPAGTDLYCQAMSGNTELYKGLCKLFKSLGYEMAGDIVDSNDMTDIYKSNDYEFFTESD